MEALAIALGLGGAFVAGYVAVRAAQRRRTRWMRELPAEARELLARRSRW
jgi:hypothetical protein